MKGPDQRTFEADLEDGPFRIGVAKAHWGLADPSTIPEDMAWPQVILWIAAIPRKEAPNRFCVRLNLDKYPSVPPTGTFWDPSTKDFLGVAKRPKGTGQVGVVFRTDWEGGRAFYHPFDRVAAQSHASEWPKKYPHLLWDPTRHTIVDFLSMLHGYLQSAEYTGI
jgi:hypothetical protein